MLGLRALVGPVDGEGAAMRRALPLLALAVLVAVPARAHVGSPNVLYDGDAGPYPVTFFALIVKKYVAPGVRPVYV